MSVRREERRDPVTGAVRKYWIVDVNFEHPDGKRERARKVSPVQTSGYGTERLRSPPTDETRIESLMLTHT